MATKTVSETRRLADSICLRGILERGTIVSFMNTSTTEAILTALSPPKLYLYKLTKAESAKEEGPYKPGQGGKWEKVEGGTPSPASGGIRPVYEAFASGKKGTYVDFDDAVKRHKMVQAIYRS